MQDTFLSHLVELRSRLMHSIIAVLVVFVLLFPWSKEIYALLARPMLHALPSGAQMIATDVTGTFLVPLKVTLMAAFLIALPYVLWQAWAFVAPGLYHNEKRLALPVIASSRRVLHDRHGVRVFLRVPGHVQLLRRLHARRRDDDDRHREVPVVRPHDVHRLRHHVRGAGRSSSCWCACAWSASTKLRAIRPYVIVGAFVVGAIFTPPDVVSQLMLAVPLWLLYELGLVLARFVNVPQPDGDEEEVAVK